jgi:hypothetical protein
MLLEVQQSNSELLKSKEWVQSKGKLNARNRSLTRRRNPYRAKTEHTKMDEVADQFV